MHCTRCSIAWCPRRSSSSPARRESLILPMAPVHRPTSIENSHGMSEIASQGESARPPNEADALCLPSNQPHNGCLAKIRGTRMKLVFGHHWVETFIQDVRYGVRQIGRSRLHAVVVVVTLALGIGLNTGILRC